MPIQFLSFFYLHTLENTYIDIPNYHSFSTFKAIENKHFLKYAHVQSNEQYVIIFLDLSMKLLIKVRTPVEKT